VVRAKQGKSREYFFLRIAIAALALTLSGQALAQGSSCIRPTRIPDVPIVVKPYDEKARIVEVRGYTLALSWSPQFCRSHPADGQCDPEFGTFEFILHGLWPEGAGSAYPQWCSVVPQPISVDVARAQFCTQPSTKLMAHEWAKHGTCATRNPADYFAASRKLFENIRFPDMNALSRRSIDVGGFKRLMSAANPRIMPSAMVISTDRKGDWLREVRICLTKAMLPEPCPRGRSGGAPDGAPLRIWRNQR
jgi:ribonuclease T2